MNVYVTPNVLKRGESGVFFYSIKKFYLSMRGKRPHNHESSSSAMHESESLLKFTQQKLDLILWLIQ